MPSRNDRSDWIPRFLEGLQFNVEITFGAFVHVVVGLLVALTWRVVMTEQGVTIESVVPSEAFKNEGRTNSPLPPGLPSPIGRLADMSIRPQLKRANPVQTIANLIRPRRGVARVDVQSYAGDRFDLNLPNTEYLTLDAIRANVSYA